MASQKPSPSRGDSPHLTDQEELVQSFVEEAKLAALLNHPSMVQIYDFGCVEREYFIAMEYLSGKDLSHLFPRNSFFLQALCPRTNHHP